MAGRAGSPGFRALLGAVALLISLAPLPIAALGAVTAARGSSSLRVRARRSRAESGDGEQSGSAELQGVTLSTDDFDSLSPPMFIIVSCPMDRKVSYVLTSGTKVGSISPLIDSGLSAPHGLAYDKKMSILYIADIGEEKIYSYRLNVKACSGGEACTSPYEIEVDGVQTIVMEEVRAAWVALDSTGSLFFTDQETNSVNRIDRQVLRRLQSQELQASELKRNTQQALEAMEQSAQSPDLQGEERHRARELSERAQETSVESLYQADEDTHISSPAGIMTDDIEIYWANQADGIEKGSIVSGLAHAHTQGQSVVVANRTNTAYGVAGTDSMILFTDEKRFLYGMKKIGGEIICLTDSLQGPRGIAWDGGQTAYVADSGGNAVYSLPVGYLAENQPLEHLLDIHNPFGLVLLQGCDPAMIRLLPTGFNCGDESSRGFSGAVRRSSSRSASALAALALLAGSLAPMRT